MLASLMSAARWLPLRLDMIKRRTRENPLRFLSREPIGGFQQPAISLRTGDGLNSQPAGPNYNDGRAGSGIQDVTPQNAEHWTPHALRTWALAASGATRSIRALTPSGSPTRSWVLEEEEPQISVNEVRFGPHFSAITDRVRLQAKIFFGGGFTDLARHEAFEAHFDRMQIISRMRSQPMDLLIDFNARDDASRPVFEFIKGFLNRYKEDIGSLCIYINSAIPAEANQPLQAIDFGPFPKLRSLTVASNLKGPTPWISLDNIPFDQLEFLIIDRYDSRPPA